MILKFSILFSSTAFVLRLASYILYDKLLTPEEQDYIFDMMVMSELVFVLSAFMATYLILPIRKLSIMLQAVMRIILFAQLFSASKELSGINTTNEPLEKLAFCIVMLIVGYFSYIRIHKWEKKQRALG